MADKMKEDGREEEKPEQEAQIWEEEKKERKLIVG